MEALRRRRTTGTTRARGWASCRPTTRPGLKLAYPFSDHWSGQLHVLNGWQIIGDNNDGKALGTQIAYYALEAVASASTASWARSCPDNDDDLRVLGDLVLTYKATPSLSLGASVDAAREGRPDGGRVRWMGVGGYARFAPPDSRTAFALRGEYYDDEDGAISGIAQTLKEFTATLEHQPASTT